MGIKRDKGIDISDIDVINNEGKLYKKSIKKCFFIDYENVKDSGLQGIAELDKHAAVIIFYSDRAFKVPLDIASVFSESRAKLIHIKVGVGIKNALDFQLVSFLGYIIAKHRDIGMDVKYFMVTKDKGFDSVKYFWRSKGVKIHRVSQIERDINEDELTHIDNDKDIESKKDVKISNSEEVKNSVPVNNSITAPTASTISAASTAAASAVTSVGTPTTNQINKTMVHDRLKQVIIENATGPMVKDIDSIYALVKKCHNRSELHMALQVKYKNKLPVVNISQFYHSIKEFSGY